MEAYWLLIPTTDLGCLPTQPMYLPGTIQKAASGRFIPVRQQLMKCRNITVLSSQIW